MVSEEGTRNSGLALAPVHTETTNVVEAPPPGRHDCPLRYRSLNNPEPAILSRTVSVFWKDYPRTTDRAECSFRNKTLHLVQSREATAAAASSAEQNHRVVAGLTREVERLPTLA
ncbi:hypothetical protein DFQ26_003926 [Actinomortierella ambigua]|nr:hypothetical protein DFQ26_003926 [Actinomortierella ambigua]